MPGQQGRRKESLADLQSSIKSRLSVLRNTLRGSAWMTSLGLDEGKFHDAVSDVATYISTLFSGSSSTHADEILFRLKRSFGERKLDRFAGLDAQLRLLIYRRIAALTASPPLLKSQQDVADLRSPLEWYPAARRMQRKIHLHIGPTNSGKTYQALKKLEEANTGVYAGPLRLLAHEVCARLNAKGKPCNLITGDEQRIRDDVVAGMDSCTVEMVTLKADVDVAVIDEIQMLAHPERGWAWTEALLGVRAKDVHLCGEERALPLVRHLAALTGEPLEVHRYERLSPLESSATSLNGDYRALRKGDCVVAFSKVKIHAIKKEIETTTGKRCAIVYGNLPPETRAQQARLFNDPSNDFDILVASDAIGMGLNLDIQRIIFQSVVKSTSGGTRVLEISELKQISGRAGRYRTSFQDTNARKTVGSPSLNVAKALPNASTHQRMTSGLVTTLEEVDLPVVQHAMHSHARPIVFAGLYPTRSLIGRFATYFTPDTPLSYILFRLQALSRVTAPFQLCSLTDQLSVADHLELIPGLTVTDRLLFCMAPVSSHLAKEASILKALARCVSEQHDGDLLRIPEMGLHILDTPPQPDLWYLSSLETLHRGLILYLWLSYRFSGVFITRDLAFYVKNLVEERINNVLSDDRFTAGARARLRREVRRRAKTSTLVQDQIMMEGGEETQVKVGPGWNTKGDGDIAMTQTSQVRSPNAI
ncbi:MAG: RNA helicase [Piccolia ochrophora]|nr:MAG: RNA helicase [Piccolia ochrophora]